MDNNTNIEKRTPPYVEFHAFELFLEKARTEPPHDLVSKEYLKQTGVPKSSIT